VLIMHRLHEDDLTGHALAQEDWAIVRLPAIAEADERVVVDTPLGRSALSAAAARSPAPSGALFRRDDGTGGGLVLCSLLCGCLSASSFATQYVVARIHSRQTMTQ
jgi:hypothetical protein